MVVGLTLAMLQLRYVDLPLSFTTRPTFRDWWWPPNQQVLDQLNISNAVYTSLACFTVHRVPKKTSHFNFRHNFAICWDIFTIFEAPCSGLIAGWCHLLHTHHRCEAFTWRDVTQDVIQAVARIAHWHGFHTTWLMVSELTRFKSCWLFFLKYHAREGVPDTHSECRWVESWNIG